MNKSIDPYELASYEILDLARKEHNRLYIKLLKVQRDTIVSYLKDVIKDKLAEKVTAIAMSDKAEASAIKNEFDNDIAIIEVAIKYLSSMKITFQSHPDDFAIRCALLKNANIHEIDAQTKVNAYEPISAIFNAKFDKNPEYTLLDKKLCVIHELKRTANRYTNRNKNIIDAVKNIKVNDYHGNPIDVSAVMKERRGKTHHSFWDLIDKILAKLGKTASLTGVKSAKFMNKVNQTLFQAERKSAKRTINDATIHDDSPKPK